MIRTTFNGNPGIIYQLDNTYSLPPHTGAVQWNGNTKKFQVSNGGGWTDIDNNIVFQIDGSLMEIIKWAERKMKEEVRIAQLVDKYPALKDAKEKYEIIYNLVTSKE